MLNISKSSQNNKQNKRIQAYYTDPTLQRSFRGHKDTVTSVLFSPDMYILYNFKYLSFKGNRLFQEVKMVMLYFGISNLKCDHINL